MESAKLYLFNKQTIQTLDTNFDHKIIQPLINLIKENIIMEAYVSVRQSSLLRIDLEKPKDLSIIVSQLKDFVVKDMCYGKCTEFQKLVWNAIAEVKFGTIMTYAELAQKIGKESAIRAVANACGHNPISIICPCHRIVPSGYKRNPKTFKGVNGYHWGSDIKQRILNYEQLFLHKTFSTYT